MRPRARTGLRQRWSLCGSALMALHVAVGGARRAPDDKRGELRWLEGEERWPVPPRSCSALRRRRAALPVPPGPVVVGRGRFF